MKLEELLKFKPRGNGIVIRAEQEMTVGGLYLPENTQMAADNTRFYVVAIGPEIKDLVIGDEVLAVGAAFTPLPLSDEKVADYFFTHDSFIKMFKRD